MQPLCTVDEVVAELKLSDKQPDLVVIGRQVDAASQAICTFGKREFGAADATASVRQFVIGSRSVYEIASGKVAIAIGDAAPLVAVTDAGDVGLAYAPVFGGFGTVEAVIVSPPLPDVVKVEAAWGFPSVLPDIHEAAIKQAAAWYVEDSSRMSQSFALEARPPTQAAPRSLLYAVRDLVRPYRYVSMA